VGFSTGCGECVPFTELIAKRGEHEWYGWLPSLPAGIPLTPANSGSLFRALVRLCISDRCNAARVYVTPIGANSHGMCVLRVERLLSLQPHPSPITTY
jgi:hypothetical protein